MESSKELRITKPLPSWGKKYHKSHKVSVELEDDVFVSSKLNDNEKTDCIDNSTSDISTNKTASTGLRRNSSRIFGYVSTLMYGRYTKDLGDYAKREAARLRSIEDIRKEEKAPKGFQVYTQNVCCQGCKALCLWFRREVIQRIGEDWVFLALLGVIMALLSFVMDYIIHKFQYAHIWLYEELEFSVVLQFVAWVTFPVVFILFSTGFVHIVAPNAIGSGIPEMKTILRGVVLKEYLSFRTLISKCVGLCTSLGSGLPIGKEGPFVHVASIVATLLSKLVTSFRGIYENESRNSEMLAAACAVGVACTFAAPIGGVLFSIEVTSVYFAVRNYWRGFFSAVCGAAIFRLMAIWFTEEETITALFKTNLRQDFPFDAIELLAFASIGVVCGFGGALFVYFHRKIIEFNRKHRKMSAFLQKNRFIYPSVIVFIIVSCSFPKGLGQFTAGELTNHQAINELFSNFTWTTGQLEDLDVDQRRIVDHWRHQDTNVYVTLTLFVIMKFLGAAIANSLPIPAGVFIPVFTIGAAFGRLVGECMAAWFPNGVRTGDEVSLIVPGGYAVVGAAALSGSVTHTISTSVIVFELTGQISHILPAVIAVLIANAVAHALQPSIYDSIIQIKKLPYLPDIIPTRSNAYNVFVEDIMVRNVKFISYISTYADLRNILHTTTLRSFPLVDAPESMILLGSVQRPELEVLLETHLGRERRLLTKDTELLEPQNGVTSSDLTSSVSMATETPSEPVVRSPSDRFKVTMSPSQNENGDKQPSLSLPKVPKSILKKSPQTTPEGSPTSRRKNIESKFASIFKTGSKNSLAELEAAEESKMSLIRFKHEDEVVPDPPERIIDMSLEEQARWEEEQLQHEIDFENAQIDPAPFQLVERTSLHKVHSLFSLLGINHAYVTNVGRLMGVVALKEVRNAIEGQLGGKPIPRDIPMRNMAHDQSLGSSSDA